MHLDWIFFIILLSAICWAYMKYIRPMVMNSIDGRQVLLESPANSSDFLLIIASSCLSYCPHAILLSNRDRILSIAWDG